MEDQTGNNDAQQLMFWLYAEAAGGYEPSSISVFEMARLLATELKGDSENQLFYGAAAQFVGKMAQVRVVAVAAGWETEGLLHFACHAHPRHSARRLPSKV